MPNYDFECTNCGDRFEANVPLAVQTTPACPKCSCWATRKVITGIGGVIFKGSGFYETDYKRKEQKDG